MAITHTTTRNEAYLERILRVPRFGTLPEGYTPYVRPRGRKGGGKGGGADFRAPFQAPNTLQSVATARIIDIIGEGPGVNLIDVGGPGTVGLTPLKSVFLDETPVMSADGTFNFEGIEVAFRPGTPDQSVIPGFERVRSEVVVALEVTTAASVTQRITDPDVTAARVKIRIPALFEQIVEGDNLGDVVGSTVQYTIEVSDNGGPFVEVVSDIISGKTVSPYDKAHRVELTPGGSPWDVRVVRVTLDAVDDNTRNRTFFSTLTEVKDARLNYPDTAVAGDTIDARQFGTRVPRRAYEVTGKEVQIPSNYDPDTRVYTGPWDLTFKTGITDNPAWLLYDILVNKRFGLGQNMPASRIDKTAFFTVGQYCDQPVSTGLSFSGGTIVLTGTAAVGTGFPGIAEASKSGDVVFVSGADQTEYNGFFPITVTGPDSFFYGPISGSPATPATGDLRIGEAEPRYTFNAVINTKQEAYALLQAIASSFQGILYWAIGAVTLSQDAPADPERIVTRSNTIDGIFDYSGSGKRSKTSVVKVRFTDPFDGYRSNIEYVEDVEMIARFDVQEKEVFAYGATTRSQARRFGQWILDTERFAPEILSYRCGLDQALLRPGQIVEVSNPDRAGLENGGRVKSYTAGTVVLDRPVTLDPEKIPYTLSVLLPDGTHEDQAIVDPVVLVETDTVVLVTPYTTDPLDGTVWGIASSSVALQLFRCITAVENEKGVYEIACIKHDPGKYDRIELGMNVSPPDITDIPTGDLLDKPRDLTVEEALYRAGAVVRSKAVLSWTAADDPRMTFWEAQVFRPENQFWEPASGDGLTQSVTIDHLDTNPGTYGFRVRGLDNFGRKGPFQTNFFSLLGLSAPPADVTGFTSTLQTNQLKFDWIRVEDLDLDHYELRYSPLTAGATWPGSQTIVDNIPASSVSVTVPAVTGSYLIKAVDQLGNVSANAKVIVQLTIGDINLNQVATFQDSPTFSGAKTNVEVVGGVLQLSTADVMADWIPLASVSSLAGGSTGFASSGIYEASTVIDLGAVFNFTATGNVQVTGLNLNATMASWATLSEVDNMAGFVENEIAVRLQIAVTDDDPSGSPVYSDFQDVTGAEFRGRACKFRLLLSTTRPFVTPQVTFFAVTIDMVDRIISGEDISSGAGAFNVTFTPAFKSARPALAVTGEDMATGDFFEITNLDDDGFTIHFKDSVGGDVDRTFDYIARGFGAVIT